MRLWLLPICVTGASALALHAPLRGYPCHQLRCAPAVAALDAVTLERQSDVLEALTAADDPSLADTADASLSYDVVSLGLVSSVEVDPATSAVSIRLVLPPDAAAAGAGTRLTSRCEQLLREQLSWVTGVEVAVEMQPAAASADDLSPLQALASSEVRPRQSGEQAGREPGVQGVKHIIAVASCKGGVGKSTTAVNLAYALAARGLEVGLVDLDVHGPSLPTMVQAEEKLQLEGEAMLPLRSGGVRLMSMGYINPGVMPLRGAKVTPVVQQLVGRTVWGELDYLVCDMPPGTGDVQLTLSQDFRVSAAVLVTTPQRLSFVDVVKGVEMFDKVGAGPGPGPRPRPGPRPGPSPHPKPSP